MSFLKNVWGKKDAPIESYSDFWNWFLKHEKEFFKIVQDGNNIHKGFLDKIAPKLDEIHDGFYFLTGMFDNQTAELILTPDGAIKNIYVIEELVNAAPKIEGWKFTALKSASDINDVGITYENFNFDKGNLKFYPNIHNDYPDEIDLTIVYDYFEEDKKAAVTNGVYIFLDNYLGELHSVTLIDNMKVVGTNDISQELIPIEKLKDYLIWREKEFVEKYEGTRHNTENDGYATFEGKSQERGVILAIINTTVLEWDKKASHPWIFIVAIPFEKTDETGLPDDVTYKLLDEIEEEIMFSLPDSDGYLNIGRETANNKREIFFACKEFRKPPKVVDALIKKYSQTFEISYEIYKDKYWQSFRHFEQN
ncbi:DUF695 domain-containing protein [Flavobacterium pectinovorum]|uniref:DUF695 domain-containing protein n=1 Tax=Flavobacterium pectinovorum TaxID=29533 RepID=A0AB36P0H0_9FLAO|nr:DUF695 domain-containing protein [Flavobacterium pectinovorum]OXB04650.1 DUF695 domain-containing protein [Flavobacterium pectinovorum]SHL25459.1 Family of unknown function [Flavobacterium pectinovorum]